MATVVKPAKFNYLSGCMVLPPQEPNYRTTIEQPKVPADAEGVVLELCDLEVAVQSKAMGAPDGNVKFLLNWADAKLLCYSILNAAANTGDVVSKKCLEVIDKEVENENEK